MPSDAADALESVAALVRRFPAPFKVCRDPSTLIALNSGELGETQVGKFCTVYPPSDAVAVEMAAELAAATSGVRGPFVPTDVHVGGAVYARYGSFDPEIRFDRLGNSRAWIHLPDGSLVEDERVVPYREREGVANPFGASILEAAPGPAEIGPGYRCIDVIRARSTGSVYLAVALRDRSGSPWRALKQARAYTYFDSMGRDRRDRLEHEHDVLRKLEGARGVPRCDDYFEHDGDGYLPVELVRGTPLLEWSSAVLQGKAFTSLDAVRRRRLVECAVELVRVVESLHEHGFLHRDLSANNVLVRPDGDLRLIDFELAHEIGSDAPPFRTGTPGFASESQLARGPARVADDVHAVGACLVAVLCGVDPRLLVGSDPGSMAPRLRAWAGGGDLGCWEAIASCFERRAGRPPWRAVERSLTALGSEVRPSASRRSRPVYRAAARRALRGLAAQEVRSVDGLPVSLEEGEGGSWNDVEEISAHAHRGVAGVLYSIALAARLGLRDPRTDALALDCTAWLLARDPSPAAHLPGLFFGRAGWAVALDDAVESGLIDRPARWDELLRSLLDGPLDWYDVTHGAAGQGLAALRLARGPRRPELLETARRCAVLLAEAQEPDGSWRAPPGVPGLSRQVLPGFAHGVAGIVYFLATAERALPDPEPAQGWRSGARWLLDAAVEGPAGDLSWRYSDTQPTIWRWWCHGAPGIVLALLRAYEVDKDEAYADAARRALGSIAADVRHPNLTQCHGLSGLGQVLLEGWRVLGDDDLLRKARGIADLLVESAHRTSDGALLWLAERFSRPTGDLMQGGGGPLHLLLSLADLDVRVPPPLLVSVG